MNRRILSFLMLAGAGLVAGCEAVPQQVVAVPVRPAVAVCSFQVVNNSSFVVRSLQFSSSAQANWGVDQLGAGVLPPGRAQNFRPNNPGNYDFRVIWQTGRMAEIRQVNPCVTPRVIVTNGGLIAR